jgi:hypothetical protein
LLHSLTMLLLSIDCHSDFADLLATETKLLSDLIDLSATIFDPVLAGSVLTMVCELLRRIDISKFAKTQFHLLMSDLRWIVNRYLDPKLPKKFNGCNILVPVLRIEDAMIAACDEFPSENMLLRLMDFIANWKVSTILYCESLRVWNRLFVQHRDRMAEMEVSIEVVCLLIGQLGIGGIPRLHVLFVLSNALVLPQLSELMVQNDFIEAMFVDCEGLSCVEKENFLILVFHVLTCHPIALLEVFPSFADFLEFAFDFIESERTASVTMNMLVGLLEIVRADPETKCSLDLERTMPMLTRLTSSGNESVGKMAELVLRAYEIE